MSRVDRGLLVAAAVVASAALGIGIGSTDLWPPDETRVAEIARELPGAHGWLVPELNGEPFLEEPPLFYWLQAAVYRIQAVPSAFGARLPATLGGLLGVLVTVLLARSVGASAALAALVLASAPEWWWMARSGTPDTANASATALALLAFLRAWRHGGGAALALAVAGVAVAFWLKSFLGLGLAMLAAGSFLIVRGRGHLTPGAIVWAGIALGAAVAAWLAALGRARGSGAVEFFVVTNHLGRLLGHSTPGHLRPLGYYLKNLALDLLPWSLALPAAAVAAWKQRSDPAKLFVLLWGATMAIALSLAATKRAHYLLAAYPALAVLVALWWMGPRQAALDRATGAVVAAAALVLYPAAIVALSRLRPAALAAGAGPASERIWMIAQALLRARPGALVWAVVPVAALGALVLLAQRAGRPGAAAAALGLSATIVHVLLALVVLPRFDAMASARPVGEALGRAADHGVTLVAFGFNNREQLSPYLFYSRHRIVEAKTARELEARVSGARACVLVPAEAYATSPPSLRSLAASRHAVGELRLMLVSGAAGGCPDAAAIGGSSP